MSALDVLYNIIENDNLARYPFKYCLVNDRKYPYNIKGNLAKTNNEIDFVNITELLEVDNLDSYKGLGVSVQFSNITAIDVDHCFNTPFNLDSITGIGLDILNMFIDETYVEFSFSGTGMRIFFKNSETIKNYQDNYYIKNSKIGVEFYEPYFSYRYVTITGKYISNNPIKIFDISRVLTFLNKYMVREKTLNKQRISVKKQSVKSKEDCLIEIKKLYFKNPDFQDTWFKKAPGSGSNESERDYKLINYLTEYITDDVEMVKELFMESPFYKSKDLKHIAKFTKNNYKYFYYIINKIL